MHIRNYPSIIGYATKRFSISLLKPKYFKYFIKFTSTFLPPLRNSKQHAYRFPRGLKSIHWPNPDFLGFSTIAALAVFSAQSYNMEIN